MSTGLDAQEAMRALVDLRDQMARRHAVRRDDPLPHDEALQLAVQVHLLHQIATWCRDASLALARTAQPEVSWPEMAEALDIPDSTLNTRLFTWRREEGR